MEERWSEVGVELERCEGGGFESGLVLLRLCTGWWLADAAAWDWMGRLLPLLLQADWPTVGPAPKGRDMLRDMLGACECDVSAWVQLDSILALESHAHSSLALTPLNTIEVLTTVHAVLTPHEGW